MWTSYPCFLNPAASTWPTCPDPITPIRMSGSSFHCYQHWRRTTLDFLHPGPAAPAKNRQSRSAETGCQMGVRHPSDTLPPRIQIVPIHDCVETEPERALRLPSPERPDGKHHDVTA